MSKNKKKPERAELRTNAKGLEVTIISLTREQDMGGYDFLDTMIRADGRGFQVTCYDRVADETAKLDNFPIGIIKLLDSLIHQLKRENGGYGDIHLTIKAGAFHSVLVRRPDGQVGEAILNN